MSSLENGVAERDGSLFFGWRMVLVAFFVDFVAVGFFFYSYGIFFKAIAVEFGDSRLGVSLGLTVSYTVGAITAPIVGYALDRFPLRRIMAIGTTLMATGFFVLSLVQTQMQFYIAIGAFIGVGAGSMGGLATAKLIANWFFKKRGTALGIAATGISVSGVVMPFISAAIIEAYGWRMGFLLYGVFTLTMVLPIVLRFVISSPEEIGQQPDGAFAKFPETYGTADSPPPQRKPSGYREIMRERNFWVLIATNSLLFCCQGATLTHMVPRLTDAGYSLTGASLVLSFTAGFGVAGKLVFGWLGDRWTARRLLWTIIGSQIIGQLMMFMLSTPMVFIAGSAFFGFGMGGSVPLQNSIVGRVFGREQFGRALGIMRPGMFPIQIIGVPLAGWVYDTTGNYTPAFMFFIVLYVAAAMVVTTFREPGVSTN